MKALSASVALVLFSCASQSTQAQVVYLSTLDKTHVGAPGINSSDAYNGMPFVTGNDAPAYALNSINTAWYSSSNYGTIESWLYLADASHLPIGSAVLTLPQVTKASGTTQFTFAPAEPFTLNANTEYVFVMHGVGSGNWQWSISAATQGYEVATGSGWQMVPVYL